MREPRWQISSRARGAGEKQSDDGLTAQTKKSAERCHTGKRALNSFTTAHTSTHPRHHQVPNAQFTPMFTVHRRSSSSFSPWLELATRSFLSSWDGGEGKDSRGQRGPGHGGLVADEHAGERGARAPRHGATAVGAGAARTVRRRPGPQPTLAPWPPLQSRPQPDHGHNLAGIHSLTAARHG